MEENPKTKLAKWEIADNLAPTPQALKHFRIVRFLLLFIGGWPDEHFGKPMPFLSKIQNRTFFVQMGIMLVGAIMYLLRNFKTMNFFAFGHVLIENCLGAVVMARIFILNYMKDYGPIIKEFMEFHLHNYKDKNEHYKAIYNLTHRVSHYFSLYMTSMTVVGVLLFNATPFYNDYELGAFSRSGPPKNETFDYSVYLQYPGYSQDDHFYFATLINTYISIPVGISFCIVDLLLCLIAFQIIGQIKTLMMELETMPRPKGNDLMFTCTELSENEKIVLYSQEENKAIHIILKDVIIHHRLIVSFTNKMSNFFGPMLGINYAFHLCSGCLLLLECSSKDTKELMRFGPLTVNIFGELILLSVVFEFVGSMSVKLIDSVYDIPWECMDTRNQKTVLFLLARIQVPIHVTAMGCVPVGVQTMQAILKTTFSYYAMLMSLSGS